MAGLQALERGGGGGGGGAIYTDAPPSGEPGTALCRSWLGEHAGGTAGTSPSHLIDLSHVVRRVSLQPPIQPERESCLQGCVGYTVKRRVRWH